MNAAKGTRSSGRSLVIRPFVILSSFVLYHSTFTVEVQINPAP